ncbi:WD40 repeat domain-containing protein [Terriglobus tenax]|uniref:WD40 repeat domain-containing protein n=1 Tax=Terriglobus tenax TaxID=1111115 RepID=UPI0021E06481|nr:WD40 repeat domain-containing protein [Terriglobus tenax]
MKLTTLALLPILAATAVSAQGTRQWTQSRYDEFEKGKPSGIAIRSDGHLQPAPATTLLYTSDGNYLWSAVTDDAGNAYLGSGAISGGTAAILKVDPQGKATKLFETKEMAVQAIRTSPGGKLYAATSPGGMVYQIDGPGKSAVVLDPSTLPEKPKYLWDIALTPKGDLYVATGAPAAIYRIPAGGKPELVLKSGDQHIRCLLLGPDGTLYAGSDGAGVIYRIKPGEKPFALYDAPRHEITALALGPDGSLYAAGVGDKRSPNLPPLPVQGNQAVSITILPGSANAASANTLIPEGSDIYQIAPDGTPQRLQSFREDVVYALTVRNGKLLVATGNRGRVYSIDPANPGVFTDVAHLDAAQGMAFAPTSSGLYIATSNSGRLFRMQDKPAATSTYISDVFDAGVFSQWGRAELRGSKDAELYLRSGNVENPEINWTDWAKVTPNSKPASSTSARYVQWKTALLPGSNIDSVTLNYLPKNLAPAVDDVVVQPGAKMNPPPVNQGQTVQVAFPRASSNPGFVMQQDPYPPLTAQKDKDSITARWAAHDDNGDELTYTLYYRGDTETAWRLLKDKVSEKYYSWDTSQLPDGGYTLRVVASDAPSHNSGETLSGDRVSARFEVDTTPPVPGTLTAVLLNGQIHATLEATDASSAIAHAEYSLDAGPWQYLEPAGKLSDSPTERYDFTLPLSGPAAEHTLAVRVYDRFENAATAKTVIRSAAR